MLFWQPHLRAGAVGLCLMALSLAPAFAAPVSSQEAAKQQRIASLDHCADRALLALMPMEQIAGVSPTAHSIYGAQNAKLLPQIKLDAEAILASGASSFVAQWGGGAKLHSALQNAGLKRRAMPQAESPQQLPAYIRDLGAELGAENKSEDLARRTEIQIDRLQAHADAAKPIKVLYLTAGGFSAGANTYVNALIALGGGQNLMADKGRTGYFPLDLEELVGLQPDLLVLGFFDAGLGETSHWGLARHKVLANFLERVPAIYVPAQALSCQDWLGLELSEAIAKAISGFASIKAAP